MSGRDPILSVTLIGGHLESHGGESVIGRLFDVLNSDRHARLTLFLNRDEAAQWAKVLAEYADGTK